MRHSLNQYVLVVGPGEIAFKQLIIVNIFSNDPSNKLEIAQMIGVYVWEIIDGVRHPVVMATLEEGIVGIEDLPGDDGIPLPQQSSSILPFSTWEQ